ncbi:MAG: hypothetical protein HYT70_01560 [Candidatus Aenigmarchaeota archaeon]|nr:hypothetical protein [Candidatus Aenigmarchaeota archaeon]
MDRFNPEQFPYLLKLLELHGGNYPIAIGMYYGLARVIGTYPRRSKVLTPDGIREVVTGSDIEVKNWIDATLQDRIAEIGVTALTGTLLNRSYPQSQFERELRRLVEVNRQTKSKVLTFYLTHDGMIYYKTVPYNPSRVSMFRVSQEEIQDAEHVIKTIKVAEYFPKRDDAGGLISEDGYVIDTPVFESKFGELKLQE